jgi:hypothetical protein
MERGRKERRAHCYMNTSSTSNTKSPRVLAQRAAS